MGGTQRAAVLSTVALLAGCATNAQIALPSDMLARTDAIEVVGIGGRSKGSFHIGRSNGRFSRTAATLRIGDDHLSNIGGARFDAAGPEFGGRASGDCKFDEGRLDWGAAEFSEKRLTYSCTLHRSGRPDAGLVLTEIPSGPGVLSALTRRGELQIDGMTLTVRAVHQFEDASAKSGTPLGYIFSLAGREVGAVDVAARRMIHLPREPGTERDAVRMAGLALLLFWDPGE